MRRGRETEFDVMPARLPLSLPLLYPHPPSSLSSIPLPLSVPPGTGPAHSSHPRSSPRILCLSPLSFRSQFPRHWPGCGGVPGDWRRCPPVRSAPRPGPGPGPGSAPSAAAAVAERRRRRRRRQGQVPGTGHRSGHCGGHGVRGGMRHRGMPGRASPGSAGAGGRCPHGCGGAPGRRGWTRGMRSSRGAPVCARCVLSTARGPCREQPAGCSCGDSHPNGTSR